MILVACTAATALGDAAAAAAGIRAGLSRVREDDALRCRPHDPAWDPDEPARAARMDDLGRLAGGERLLALALAAGRELAGAAGLRRSDLPATALAVVLPAVDAATAGWGLPALAQRVADRLGLRTLAAVEAICEDRLGVFTALERMAAGMAAGTIRHGLVIAADSLVEPERFAALDAAGRVRSQRSPGGMLPGEAAAGLCVTRDGAAAGGPRIAGSGRGRETATIASGVQSTGCGMQDAIAAAAPGDGPVWHLGDLTGEPWRHREWGLVIARCPRPIPRQTLPAAGLGDCGACNPAIALAVAAAGFARGWAPAPALITAGADDGGRAALLLERRDR